jgi:hypothetical protein
MPDQWHRLHPDTVAAELSAEEERRARDRDARLEAAEARRAGRWAEMTEAWRTARTGAAEIATPVLADLRWALSDLEARLARSGSRLLEDRRTRLRAAARGLPARPEDVLALPQQRLELPCLGFFLLTASKPQC